MIFGGNLYLFSPVFPSLSRSIRPLCLTLHSPFFSSPLSLPSSCSLSFPASWELDLSSSLLCFLPLPTSVSFLCHDVFLVSLSQGYQGYSIYSNNSLASNNSRLPKNMNSSCHCIVGLVHFFKHLIKRELSMLSIFQIQNFQISKLSFRDC